MLRASTMTNATHQDFAAILRRRFKGTVSTIQSLAGQIDAIAEVALSIVAKLAAGGTMYTAGNGGSAAHALHLAEEFIGRYRRSRAPRRAVCLNADPTALTCIANDFGFDQVFSRPCEALIRPGDVLVIFSTSGTSANVVGALEVARGRGAMTVGILGGEGGHCRALCDRAILVSPPDGKPDSAYVQEAHQVILHMLCEAAELRQD
jgi:D-sedoheptulose 7-phosphate isomerase